MWDEKEILRCDDGTMMGYLLLLNACVGAKWVMGLVGVRGYLQHIQEASSTFLVRLLFILQWLVENIGRLSSGN